jgi:hypothetical protein
VITRKKILPGQPGTKKLVEKYGKNLICVRYKYDDKQNTMIKTVELLEEVHNIRRKKNWISPNKKVKLKIDFNEKYLQKLIKQAGGRWNSKNRVWELNFKEVNELGLKNRIVK